MMVVVSQSGHVHCQFGIRFFLNWFNNLIRVNRINRLFDVTVRVHRFLNWWELFIKFIITYIEKLIVGTHGVVRATVVSIHVHLQLREFLSVSFFLVDFCLLLFDVIIILIRHNHLSCHSLTTLATMARFNLHI